MRLRQMRPIGLAVLAAGTLAFGFVTAGHAQQGGATTQPIYDTGKKEYEAHCAVCHGATGEGNGPYAPYLTSAPANLTTLAKRNGGVFPVVRVYETIDGRERVPAHGPTDMPVWGPRYSAEIGEGLYDDIRVNRAAYTRARILLLTEYIARLQAK